MVKFSADLDAKVYVAGHRGLVGSAIMRALAVRGFRNILCRTSQELDLRDAGRVRQFFQQEKPDYVFLAAAKVGGIFGNNTYPADFIYDNLAIALNIINSSFESQVKKLLFMGSSCIYPRECPQPIKEEYLLTGPLEATNEPYAIAKIAGIKLCQSYNRQHRTNYISVMPTNLYGRDDNFDLATSHVIPALIRKFVEASLNKASAVEIWGTGRPYREFLHVDDLANGCILLMDEYNESGPVNIGYGEDLTIAELAELVADIAGYKGKIVFNPGMPDGTPRKLLDCSKINRLGWRPKITLNVGLEDVIGHYRQSLLTRGK